MRRLLLAVFVLLVAMGSAYGKDMEIKKKTASYDVEVRMDKNPPVVGDNNIEIKIMDSAGNNVTDAKVTVEYSMPPMSGMPAMNYKDEASLNGDDYKAKINLSMSGAWNVSIKIRRDGKSETVKFNVDAKK